MCIGQRYSSRQREYVRTHQRQEDNRVDEDDDGQEQSTSPNDEDESDAPLIYTCKACVRTIT